MQTSLDARPVASMLRLALCATAVALTACSGKAVRRVAPPPFIPVERQYLPLPAGVMPFQPTFTPDGRDIVFLDGADRTVWIIRADGSELRCIDCGFADRPTAQRSGGFAYTFADGQRLLLTRGLGKRGGGTSGADADAWVLECAPSLRDCASHRFVDVDLSADAAAFPILHRRFWHLAPDGAHLGWMNVRTDGTAIIVARLERQADRYVAADPRAVNPPGPADAGDRRADRWENLSQLYELKSFTPDGRGILAVGLPGNNVDVIRIDLETGRQTRLTGHPDWDEDSSLSPDQQLFVVNSWRGRQRLDALSWIPQIRGFTGLMLGAAIAPFYVSTWAGFQCDLSPWLLPASGDQGGKLLGQPLDVYAEGLTGANNVAGQQVWSPDSTRVLLMEKTRTPPPGAGIPNRIAIARLLREPTRPVAVSASNVGAWAPPASQHAGPHAADRTVVVRGDRGGTATLRYSGALGKDAATSVRFERFTDDGRSFVDGTMEAASRGQRWTLRADVAVSGEHAGRLDMDLKLDNAAKPLPTKEGTITAVYDGRSAPLLPELGACYDKLPQPSPLRLQLVREGASLRATVTADIQGDVRPVAGAVVRSGSARARTDLRGIAVIALPAAGADPVVTASAGDTFIDAVQAVPQPRR